MLQFLRSLAIGLCVVSMLSLAEETGIIDKNEVLRRQTFWDNKDFDWYKQNIPFFDSPDAELNTTYYYRCEVITKHLVYGSPQTGYTFTEFIDRPGWSGAYGAISCPAGHQLYEVRWLKNPAYSRDFAKYWFRTPGAAPRNYSTWLADAVWALNEVRPDSQFMTDLLPDLKKNYREWEKSHFVADVGMFWQTGMADGMETNINSRQTKDWFAGAPGYRPTLNSYLFADAKAIARIAELAGDKPTAQEFSAKAASLKEKVQKLLWDPKREFFFHMYKQDEQKDGFIIKALSLTHQTGKYAGDEHGRELIGYVPWQFNLPDSGYESAWKFLMNHDFFGAEYGPTTTERHDPLFQISKGCCVWSGQSWPYATTQTLKALANLLQNYKQDFVSRKDYYELLRTFALTHRKNGKPYIAEAAHPDTGSWEGHDHFNHSEHYFHSGFIDLVITGLVGLKTSSDSTLEIDPLAPREWEFFALDGVDYHGTNIAIVWDKTGKKYNFGAGFHILANGKVVASRADLGKLSAQLPPANVAREVPARVNFAVNNEGRYYPRVAVSYANAKAPASMLNDGNYWYHVSPPNRWTCEGTKNASDWCELQFGIARTIDELKLYFLDDGENICAPASYAVQTLVDGEWKDIPDQTREPAKPEGRRANVVRFAPLAADRIRFTMTHKPGSASGLTEIEAWGLIETPLKLAPPPDENLAYKAPGAQFPKVSASYTCKFDRIEEVNDGIAIFRPNPHNRWTTFQSPNSEDWLEIDFGAEKSIGRVDISIFDDRGGVQAPEKFIVESWDGSKWSSIPNATYNPAQPIGGAVNTVTFPELKSGKIRAVFTHKGKARSGITEIEVWKQ